MITRRQFIKLAGASGAYLYFSTKFGGVSRIFAQIPGGTMLPEYVDKFVLPLVKPPAMPGKFNKNKDKYKIAIRQFQQRIISPPHPVTTVWSYGDVNNPGPAVDPDTGALTGGTFNYPAFTIEATANKETQVVWSNELVDGLGNPLPHLLPVDPTLHWANPIGMRDTRPMFSPYAPYWNHPYLNGANGSYRGPVPMVTHVHGAHAAEDSDGYAEAWWLPAAAYADSNIQYPTGTFYDYFNSKYNHNWSPGSASFKYMNDQPATTLWYHDHTLGMTRLNVYAGPAGYWLIRNGMYDMDLGYVAPGVGDSPLGEYTEIPIAIQDRSFNLDGSLFYPDARAFFEGLNIPPTEPYLDIPFIPDIACDGLPSDVSPIWQPEFFGNMMVVNGFTWPYLEVEQRRYRFRFLNGCNSRFLILKMTKSPRGGNDSFNTPEHSFWQIGAEQGFLPAPVELDHLLMAPAERADVIVDFSNFSVGDELYLVNDGPDAPFSGIGLEDLSDWESTGQVMKFIVKASTSVDTTTPPDDLELPPQPELPTTNAIRQISLNEEESVSVRVSEDGSGNIVWDCATGEVFGPTAALLGTLKPDNSGNPLLWSDIITENPNIGDTEEWEIHNFTADAHPIHIHLIKFKVLGRGPDGTQPPEAWESGFKDTVIAYPGEITRVKANYDLPGFYVWHCHIVEHEDNEMMRPYHVGPIPPDAPAQ